MTPSSRICFIFSRIAGRSAYGLVGLYLKSVGKLHFPGRVVMCTRYRSKTWYRASRSSVTHHPPALPVRVGLLPVLTGSLGNGFLVLGLVDRAAWPSQLNSPLIQEGLGT
jgi:hypothetical protein